MKAKASKTARRTSKKKPARVRLADPPRLDAATAELHFSTTLAIPALDLVNYAQAAAEQFLADYPSVVFTSGRRDAAQQGDAMARKIVQNRTWIEETYIASRERDQLKSWVDTHPPPPRKRSSQTVWSESWSAGRTLRRRSCSGILAGQHSTYTRQPARNARRSRSAFKAFPISEASG